jgi:hypothetical protein
MSKLPEIGRETRDLDHETRVKIAFDWLRREPFPEATRRIRDDIRAERRYHETLTLAWTRLIAASMDRDAEDFAGFLTRYPFLSCPDTVLSHYSPERLASDRARREFVLPDREPLPRIQSTRPANSIIRGAMS